VATLLERLTGPADLHGLDDAQLATLAAEIRETIVATVAKTGGHLGSSLGVVELTIALHRLLDSPRDKIVWDTGHQAYAHKLVTGRLDRFGTLRQLDGIGGFPRRSESEHDVFDGGHAGTGLSIAEGLAAARDLRRGSERIAVVVGDAALMTGLSLEALNDIGHRGTQMLIVLNDNEMSISPTVGAFSTYLSKIKLSGAWRSSKSVYDRFVERIPLIGRGALMWSQRLRRSVVNLASPGQLFEDLGITYIGVIPGHDLRALDETFRGVLRLKGPVIVHVRTQKGRGYRPAETDQVSFHGAALPPMDLAPRVDAMDGARTPSLTGGPAPASARAVRPGSPHGAGSNGDAVAQLHGRLRQRAGDGCRGGQPDRGDHRRDADGHGPLEVPGGLPGAIHRRRDRRAARGHDGRRAGDRGHASGRGDLLDLPPAGLRPDRPRRLPERPAGPARRGPRRARGRGRHVAPGDVHDPGAAAAAVPDRGQPQG
jgi:transketolase N-terminal domain/subunit